MMDRKSKQFLGVFISAIVLLVVSYSCFFRYGVVKQRNVVPQTYKQFLLENVEGPRIIIDSGSNGLHSIEGELFESLTGYPTIILSDHAGASLQDKLKRLLRYAKPGDRVILPLEWNYYYYEDLGEVHLRTSLNEVSNYYWSLPLLDQFSRAFKTPFRMVAQRLYASESRGIEDWKSEIDRLQFYYNHNFKNDPYGGVILNNDVLLNPAKSICDDYVIPELAQRKSISKDFKASLRILQKLRRKNIDLILIPPVVVGNDCYEKYANHLDELLVEAHHAFDRSELSYIADYQKYAFEGRYIQDTHFHINEEARNLYTANLVEDLVACGWLVPQELKPESRVIEQVPPKLLEKRFDVLSEKMNTWRGNPTEVYFGDDRNVFYFGEDWYPEEMDRGRWALKAISEVVFRPESPAGISGVYLNAYYFNGSQATKVFLNGEYVGSQDFTLEHLLKLPKPLSEYLKGTELIRMRFESSGLISPYEVDGSVDHRKLKFGLHSIELIQ